MNRPPITLKTGHYHDAETRGATRVWSTLLANEESGDAVFACVRVDKRFLPDLHGAQRIFEDELPHAAAALDDPNSQTQRVFEKLLANINHRLAADVANGVWNIPIERFSANIGLIKNGEIFLSGNASPEILFLHRTEAHQYEIFNLSRGLHTEQNLATWEKPFAVILDGEFVPGDVLCLSGTDLQAVVPQLELNEILVTLPPTGAAEKIRQYFPTTVGLTLIILQAPAWTDAARPNALYSDQAKDSVDHLMATQDNTNALLDDQHPGKFISRLTGIKKYFAFLKPGLAALGKKLLRARRQLVSWLAHYLLRAWLKKQLESAAQTHRKFLSRVREHLRPAASLLPERFAQKAKFRFPARYLIIIAAVFCVLLFVGLAALRQKQAAEQIAVNYEQQVAAISDLIEQGAAAIIYRDEEKARQFYQAANAKLELLPRTNQTEDDQYQELQAQIQSAEDGLRHVIHITDPPKLADLSDYGDLSRALVWQNPYLWVLMSDGRTEKIKPADKSRQSVLASALPIAPLQNAADATDSLLALETGPGLASFNPSGENWRELSVAWPSAAPLAIRFYANKLYILTAPADQADAQVWRLNPTTGGFTTPTAWIKSKTASLWDATDIAIDGTIFVLKKDGQIFRFASGAEVGWNAVPADPPISQATRLWTDQESNFLYFIDPPTARLIVYQKENGNLVAQYQFADLAAIRDFTINETDRQLYLLTANAVYSVGLNHLP